MANELIKRKTFRRSFLKNVQAVFSCDAIQWTQERKEQIVTYLQRADFTCDGSGNLPMMQAKREQSVLVVSNSGVMLAMDVRDYVSFEKFIDTLVLIPAILNILNCETIKSFLFQKLNSYKFTKSEDGKVVDEETAYHSLFEPSVIKTRGLVEMHDGSLSTCMLKFNEEEGYTVASLLVSVMHTDPIAVENLIAEMGNANEIIYQVWYKSTLDKVRMMMDKEI